jgi:hypothetical protein
MSEGGAERVREVIDDAEEVVAEAPRPLMRELPPADPFPADALGELLGRAAIAIHERVQAPIAICGQSVLGAATLVVQGHADVELPTDQTKPVSEYYLTAAPTGERKSAVDDYALSPVRKRESALREQYEAEQLEYRNSHDAWDAARKAAIRAGKGNRGRIKDSLDALGPAPLRPLDPMLVSGEPTYEGLCKALMTGQPSIGVFTAEGGQFIGGHGMAEDAKLRTAAGLSYFWDGKTNKRVRATEGVTILPGRRVAMHLLAQPDVAALWTGDPLLLEQGLMSRVLVSVPETASGRRLWKIPNLESGKTIEQYDARLLGIMDRPLPVAANTRNELMPRAIKLTPSAQKLWIGFYDHVEKRVGPGGELEPARGLANKLPEHAARLAAVLTLISDIDAGEIAAFEMQCGIGLAEHYVSEALRLHGASHISGQLREAQRLLAWLLNGWTEPLISLPDIYQQGPNSIRDAERARNAVVVLEDHGWLVRVPEGGTVAGVVRRDVWRIFRE